MTAGKKMLLVLPLLVLGCGSSQKKTATAAPLPQPIQNTTVTSAPLPAQIPEPHRVSSSLGVADEIARACNLSFGNFNAAPKFDLDEEALHEDDKAVLDKIAKCVTTGPLRGRAIKLVGHADPRGATEYNMSLGARRANNVATVLSSLGVANDKVQSTSRGELDATGTDEDSWRTDRRVDILLGY